MTEANWTDLLSTIRLVFANTLQIATVIVGGAAAYYAYKGKVVGEKNSSHLAKQEGQLASIDTKVTNISADPLQERVQGLTAALQAIRDEPGPGAS